MVGYWNTRLFSWIYYLWWLCRALWHGYVKGGDKRKSERDTMRKSSVIIRCTHVWKVIVYMVLIGWLDTCTILCSKTINIFCERVIIRYTWAGFTGIKQLIISLLIIELLELNFIPLVFGYLVVNKLYERSHSISGH